MTATTVLGPQGYSRPPYKGFMNRTAGVGAIYYIFQFPDVAAAQRDLVVSAHPFSEVLVFADITKNSVVPNAGYWCRIIQINQTSDQTSMLAHPNLQVVFDIRKKVLTSRIPVAHIGIVTSNFDNFIPDGLIQ